MILVSLLFSNPLPLFSFYSGDSYAQGDRKQSLWLRIWDTLISAVCSHYSGCYSIPNTQESLIPSRVFYFGEFSETTTHVTNGSWLTLRKWYFLILSFEQHGVLSTTIIFMHNSPRPSHLGNSVRGEFHLYPKRSLSGHSILHSSKLILKVQYGWSIMSCQF